MKIGNFSSKRVSDIHSDQKISNYTLSLSDKFEKHKVQTLIKSLSSEKMIRSSGCAPPAVDDDAAWHGDGHPDDDGGDGGYDDGDLDND